MADAIVSVAVEQLLLLFKEKANLLKGIHKDFDDIKKELESIQAFLRSADRKIEANGDDGEDVKIWVKEVMNAAYRIEDVIDEYMFYVSQQPRDPGCVAPLKKIAHLIKTLISRPPIASKIKEIKSDVREIKERSERYHLESQNVKWHDPQFTSLYIEEAELVGFEDPSDDLVDRLVQGPKERALVVVIGIAGLGKTTIAKKAFDSKRVVDHFHRHVWITVSQSYSVELLLRKMLRKLCEEIRSSSPEAEITLEKIDRMDRQILTNKVRENLLQKRYIVVFDDVWDIHFLNDFEFALLDNELGSRIIITTRNEEVVQSCQRNSSFVRLQPLSLEKSQELFYKKAFKSGFNGSCPEDLMEISSKILTECCGLPLAIVVIGGQLSSKEKTKMEWERFYQSLSSELGNVARLHNITRILGLSYDDLPYFLKLCLLYFAMYPEDYEVKSERLIGQWVAEGFIRPVKEKTLEEVAEGYLRELIDRSWVQVSSFTKDGKVKSCGVHGLQREMILKKSEDLSFCQFIGEDDRTISDEIRRLAVATSNRSRYLPGSIESSFVRSLFFFENGDSKYDDYFHMTRLWKVLFVEHHFGRHGSLENLGNLIHLKYLCIRAARRPRSSNFPKCIGKLQNLETLILLKFGCMLFPKEISQVKKLRHVMVKEDAVSNNSNISFIEGKDYIGGMTCLQTLRNVNVEGDQELIRELGKLRQMRNLGLVGVVKEQESTLCSSLNVMQHLEILFIRQKNNEFIDLNSISSSSFPKLRKLHLQVNIEKVPEWVLKLQTLTKLILEWTRLIEDPAESLLQRMPNLLYLKISRNGYEGKSLHFHDGGFQKLQELVLTYLDYLSNIIIDEGALQSLRKLSLGYVRDLWTAPSGINHLNKLERFICTAGVRSILEDQQDPRIEISHSYK